MSLAGVVSNDSSGSAIVGRDSGHAAEHLSANKSEQRREVDRQRLFCTGRMPEQCRCEHLSVAIAGPPSLDPSPREIDDPVFRHGDTLKQAPLDQSVSGGTAG